MLTSLLGQVVMGSVYDGNAPTIVDGPVVAVWQTAEGLPLALLAVSYDTLSTKLLRVSLAGATLLNDKQKADRGYPPEKCGRQTEPC